MDVDVRLLRSFVAVRELGSLSRAAARLNCTQAAMSMRLQRLEAEVGGLLFDRGPHATTPTARGEEFYARALVVLAAYDEMMSATRSSAPRPRLRIGAPDDYAFGLLPGALARLRAQEPDCDYEIVCDLSAHLAAMLRRGELDFALLTLPSPPDDVVATFEAPLLWVLGDGFASAPDAPAPLAAYPEGCVFRRTMIDALERQGRAWRIAAQSRHHTGIMAAVRAGLAVTVAARGTAPPDLLSLASGRGLPPLPPAPIYFQRRAGEPTAATQRAEASFREGLAPLGGGA